MKLWGFLSTHFLHFASSSGCYFSLSCALLAANFCPPSPFTTVLLKHVPALNYLCSAERWLSPSEKQSSFQPVQQEAYPLLSPFQGGEVVNNLLKYSFSFHQHTDSQEIKISFYLSLSFSSPPRVKSALITKGSYLFQLQSNLGVLLTAGRWGFNASSCRCSGMGFLPHAGEGATGTVAAAIAPGSGMQGMQGGSRHAIITCAAARTPLRRWYSEHVLTFGNKKKSAYSNQRDGR